ncbi:MAG: hypothetical protein WBJ10_16355 [Daejeonella sp.]|uniref:hypothetical protein n=1 Tax=Daejeonella sp. TaxID=2805397 RepID=UPI003C719995
MLHSISWLQYAIAISLLLTVYYLAVILIYYRPQIVAMVNGKGQYPNDIEPYPVEKNVLGEIQPDHNGASILSEELQFSSDQADQLTEENH